MKIHKPLVVLMYLLLVTFCTGCGNSLLPSPTPTRTPTTTPAPTATLPAMLTNEEKSICYPRRSESCGKITDTPPPLCGIIPGQTTLVEAQSRLGPEGNAGAYAEPVRLPSKHEAEGGWISQQTAIALDYDHQGYVVGVAYTPCGLTLGELVTAYGPPAMVYFGAYCEGGDYDCSAPPYDFVEFAWPEQGVLAQSDKADGLYIQDGHSLPFSPAFSIQLVEYYASFALTDHENNEHYYAGSMEKFEWPGFAESKSSKED